MVVSNVTFVIPGAPGEAVSVSTAGVTEPAARMAFCLSQVSAKFPEAACGFQLLVVMVNVTAAVPLFLTYIVKFATPPGSSIPQGMLVIMFVQPMFENTTTPTARTRLELEKAGEEISAAEAASTVPMTAIEAIAPIVVLFIAIVFSLFKIIIVYLNKQYCIFAQHKYR